jgi:hypothetical protein
MQKITTTSIALIAFALAGCAGTGGSSNTQAASATPASGTAYCAADQLQHGASSLTCNWSKTAKEACESRASTSVATSTVADGPNKGGMCANGNRLVYVTMK